MQREDGWLGAYSFLLHLYRCMLSNAERRSAAVPCAPRSSLDRADILLSTMIANAALPDVSIWLGGAIPEHTLSSAQE